MVIEITVDHDLSELEDFASDTEEMPPLEPEDVPYVESPHNNDAPIRRDESRCVRAQQLAEIEYFMDPINALERSKNLLVR